MIAKNIPKNLIALSFLLPLLAVSSWYIVARGVSFREIIVLLMVVVILLVLTGGQRALYIGLLFWVLLLGLGYRTIEVTGGLRLHPLEILLWGLMPLLLIMRRRSRLQMGPLWLPRWVWLFIPFWAWGWVTGLSAGRHWISILSEFKNFVVLIPLFLLVEVVLHEQRNWRPVVLFFFIASTWIAGMGLVEFFFPGVQGILPGFSSNPYATLVAGGFQRASFSFWGASAATFICVLAVPMILPLWPWYPGVGQRILFLLAAGAQIFAVYLGGYRSMWILLAVEILIWVLLRFGLLPGGLLLLPLGYFYQFLPVETQDRAMSVLLTLEGVATDNSTLTRLSRAMASLQEALSNPLGIGWAGSGWTHSDFSQVTANLGILAGLLFLGAWLVTLFRLWSNLRGTRTELNRALLLSFLACGGLLAVQGVGVLPQLILPVWFVWALVELQLKTTGNTAEDAGNP